MPALATLGKRTATNSSYTNHYRRQRGRALNKRPGTTASQSTNTREDANYRDQRARSKRLEATGSSSTGGRALSTRPPSTGTSTSSSEDQQQQGAPKEASVNTDKRVF